MPGLVRGVSLKDCSSCLKGAPGLLQASVQKSFYKDELVEPNIFKRGEGRLLGAETEVGEKGKVEFLQEIKVGFDCK